MNHTIVASARGWIGTRFQHQGRVKKTHTHKGGVDCLGLLVGVAAELNLIGHDGILLTVADETHYPHHPDTRHLHKRLSELLTSIARNEIMPGDIVLLKVDDSPQHLAIVSDMGNGLGIIHAYAPARAVVEHHFDNQWLERVEAVFRIQLITIPA